MFSAALRRTEALVCRLFRLCPFPENRFRPAGDMSGKDCVKHALAGAGVFRIELLYKLLGILALRISVDGTFALYDRKIIFVFESDHFHLAHKHKRTYDREIHPVQICPR